MKKLRLKIKNLKVRYKIILIYFVIGFLPLVVIGFLFLNQINNLIVKQEKKNNQNSLHQAVTSMDNTIKIYNNLSDYMAFNETIANVLSSDYTSKYELYNQISLLIDPTLNSVQYFHTDIVQLTIYARDDIVEHNTTLAPLYIIEEQPWYQKAIMTTTPTWYVDMENKKAINVRKMPALDRKGLDAVLYIEINYDRMFDAFKISTSDNYAVFILDEDRQIIYENQTYEEKYASSKIDRDNLDFYTDSNDYYVVSDRSSETNWTIYYLRPAGLITSELKPINLFLLLVVFLSIVGASIALLSTSNFLVGRLEKLLGNIKSIEDGDLEAYVKSDANDEIGDLINGFTTMVERIKFLIEEVYESNIKQKNYEMRALQQQINPHFLYNTLSMINFMALESGRDDISKITLALSDFYRTSLNRGNNICSIKDEIKNMNGYLDIQMVMHDYDFDLDIEIEDDILESESVNLILQPIVENAILHGIDLLEDRKGIIKIYATKNDNIIYIMIEDNGVGMDNETIERMLSENSKGYGIRNVNERIKLMYGEDYGIYIESVIGQGTVVTVKLPDKKFKN